MSYDIGELWNVCVRRKCGGPREAAAVRCTSGATTYIGDAQSLIDVMIRISGMVAAMNIPTVGHTEYPHCLRPNWRTVPRRSGGRSSLTAWPRNWIVLRSMRVEPGPGRRYKRLHTTAPSSDTPSRTGELPFSKGLVYRSVWISAAGADCNNSENWCVIVSLQTHIDT